MTAVADGFGLSRIGQIAMTVGDLPRAVAFYRDVLGMRFLFEAPPAMAFFDCGGVRLMLSLPEEDGHAAGQRFASIIYYAVDDIQAAAAALERARRGVRGGRRTSSRGCRTPICGWRSSAIPDGNLLAIMSEVRESAEVPGFGDEVLRGRSCRARFCVDAAEAGLLVEAARRVELALRPQRQPAVAGLRARSGCTRRPAAGRCRGRAPPARRAAAAASRRSSTSGRGTPSRRSRRGARRSSSARAPGRSDRGSRRRCARPAPRTRAL